MGKGPLDSPPTPSCRLDWLSLSYFAATEELQARQLGYFLEAFSRFVPEPVFKQGAGRKFYEASFFHEAGLSVKFTAPDGSRNAGHLTIDLKGEFFKLVSPSERAAIYLDAVELEGFRQCTRLDAQRTLLDPEADAEQIHRMVREREIWVPRYSAYSQLGPMDSKGDAVKGASVVWGTPRSAARGMTYNKALEDDWSGVRAVRHEVKLGKQPARDCFQVLVQLLLEEEGPSNNHLAEVTFVQSVLAKQMTYLDTSRLAGIPDKREWPENWAKDSQPAAFWSEVVSGVPVELRTQWRVEKALEDSVRAEKDQYGAKEGMYALWRMYAHGETRQDVMENLFSMSIARLKPKHLDELLPLIPEANREALAADWQAFIEAAAHNLEHFSREDPVGGKTDTVL